MDNINPGTQVPEPEEIKRKLISEWMLENLNVDQYRNGDLIPNVQDKDEWSKLTTGAWCYYDNDPEKGKIYGKLYNWYAVNDPRGFAPVGWHIPSDAEWTKLTACLGGEKETGSKLKSTTLWTSPNKGATNESGFTGLPGGSRDGNGSYLNIVKYGYFWSASEYNNLGAWDRCMSYSTSYVYRFIDYKQCGESVRCVRD
jgi:uncharacterized protein (TIGR02145 family)